MRGEEGVSGWSAKRDRAIPRTRLGGQGWREGRDGWREHWKDNKDATQVQPTQQKHRRPESTGAHPSKRIVCRIARARSVPVRAEIVIDPLMVVALAAGMGRLPLVARVVPLAGEGTLVRTEGRVVVSAAVADAAVEAGAGEVVESSVCGWSEV